MCRQVCKLGRRLGVTELDATASQSQLRGWGRPRGQRLFLHRRLQMLKPSWQHLLILLCCPFLFSFPCFLPEPGIRDIPPTSPIPCLCLSQPTHNRDNRGGTEEQTPMQDLRAWHQVCTILRAFLAHAGGRGNTGREEAWPCSPRSPFCGGSFMQTALCKQGTWEAELPFTNCRERGKMKA